MTRKMQNLIGVMTSLPQNIPFSISTSDPVRPVSEAEAIVVGQLGQTLDGCIATSTGDSKYINSDSGLRHLHSLRSAVDAVVVGVGCVNADDPQLTVRLCEGENPVRVILDPRGRVDLSASLFSDEHAHIIVVTSSEISHPAAERAEIISLQCNNNHIEPQQIVAALKERGYKRLLIEGGNCTLSRFMDAGVLDRLHLIVAPMIMGAGIPGLSLSPIDKLQEALRPEVTLYPHGHDIIFDCNLRVKAAA